MRWKVVKGTTDYHKKFIRQMLYRDYYHIDNPSDALHIGKPPDWLGDFPMLMQMQTIALKTFVRTSVRAHILRPTAEDKLTKLPYSVQSRRLPPDLRLD